MRPDESCRWARDSGVYVEGLGRAEQTSRHTHRLVFWPRTNSPLLLVTNLHPKAAAHFGRIRVLRASGRLGRGAADQLSWQESQRMVAAYLARPLVPEIVRRDRRTRRDHRRKRGRLADVSRGVGSTGRVPALCRLQCGHRQRAFGREQHLSEPADCSRRRCIEPGRTVAGTVDLPEHDGLEMMLRVFDREGLALVPSLQLAAPLPELEQLRRGADPQTSGLEWVGGDGRDVARRSTAPSAACAVLQPARRSRAAGRAEVVREIVGAIRSARGVGRPGGAAFGNGYAQLPGAEWGFDDTTIARFERDTGVPIIGRAGRTGLPTRQTACWASTPTIWRAMAGGAVDAVLRPARRRVASDGRRIGGCC